MDGETTVGHIVREHVKADLAVEQQRKASVETRGISVITTSGTLVTLLLGLAALLTKNEDFVLSAGPQVLVRVGAALFVLAAVLAILCVSPRGYLQVDPASLQEMVQPDAWSEPADEAERELTAARLIELADGRARNERKARLLVAALSSQVLAVMVTAAAVAVILGNA